MNLLSSKDQKVIKAFAAFFIAAGKEGFTFLKKDVAPFKDKTLIEICVNEG